MATLSRSRSNSQKQELNRIEAVFRLHSFESRGGRVNYLVSTGQVREMNIWKFEQNFCLIIAAELFITMTRNLYRNKGFEMFEYAGQYKFVLEIFMVSVTAIAPFISKSFATSEFGLYCKVSGHVV